MPRPANPEVRSGLLAAGEQLIHQRGFNASGVKDITAVAGVPKGSFYNYFASKDDFAIAVVEEYWASIEARYGALLSDLATAPLDRIRSFFRVMTDDNEARDFTLGCLLGNLSLELADGRPDLRLTLGRLFARWESSLADCISAAQLAGEVSPTSDPAVIAATLIEAWEGAVMRGKVEQTRAPYTRFETIAMPRLLA